VGIEVSCARCGDSVGRFIADERKKRASEDLEAQSRAPERKPPEGNTIRGNRCQGGKEQPVATSGMRTRAHARALWSGEG
jgi:hypothetical protein